MLLAGHSIRRQVTCLSGWCCAVLSQPSPPKAHLCAPPYGSRSLTGMPVVYHEVIYQWLAIPILSATCSGSDPHAPSTGQIVP